MTPYLILAALAVICVGFVAAAIGYAAGRVPPVPDPRMPMDPEWMDGTDD